jgi:transcription initiation factor TFIID TATA-box-binding protein
MADQAVRFSEQEDREWAKRSLRFDPDPWPEDMHRPDLHNVVGQTNLCCLMDRIGLVTRARSADFPRSFPAVTIRIKPPKVATLRCFSTGALTCCGTSSQQAMAYAMQRLRKTFLAQGMPVGMRPIVYENHVYSYDLGHEIDNARVEKRSDQFAVHCPETFPGLVFRLKRPRMQLLLFSSGKIMMTGVRNPNDADVAVRTIHGFLDEYRPLGSSSTAATASSSESGRAEKPRKAQERTRRRDADRKGAAQTTTAAAAAAPKPPKVTQRMWARAVSMVEDENPGIADDDFDRVLDETIQKLVVEKQKKDAEAAEKKRKRQEAMDAARAEDEAAERVRAGLPELVAPPPPPAAPVAAAATTGGEMDFLLQHMPDLAQELVAPSAAEANAPKKRKASGGGRGKKRKETA